MNTRSVVYKKIINDAQKIANSDTRKPPYLQGNIFITSADEALALEYNKVAVTGAIISARSRGQEKRSFEEVVKDLDDAAYDAIYDSIFQNQKAFTALMIENARAGKGWTF